MKQIDKKSKKRLIIILASFSLGVFLTGRYIVGQANRPEDTAEADEVKTTVVKKVKKKSEKKELTNVQMDVPLESQFSGYALNNGCEVTALSMLLNYYGYQTTKNSLAKLMYYVPVIVENGYRGNPHDGFVGDITGGELAMGADVEPVSNVAKQVVGDDFKVVQSQETSMDDLIKVLNKKTPIWVKVTQEFTMPNDYSFMYWNTTSGQVKVTPLNHAVVITGYDKNNIYVNDPYGYKDRAVPKDDFEYIFDAMGRQSIYLSE